MSIATEISRLQSAKADIKTAIEGKGVSVPSSALLDDYADYIELIQGGDGLTNEVKDALLDLARNIAYTTPDAQELYDALFEAFYPVSSISAVFNQGSNVIYDTDSLDDLKQYLTVTATYDDGTSGTVTGYTLSGTLEEGTSTITVTYGGKTTTFNVTVTHNEWTVVARFSTSDLRQGSISNSYSGGTSNDYTTTSGTSHPIRVCTYFYDISDFAGYTFKVEFESTASDTVYYGVNSYNETAITATQNHTTIQNADTNPHGWYENGTEFTMESTLNNSAVVGMRVNWSCGSSHNKAISSSQIDNVVVYAKPTE